jgi:hypothetical protein
LVFYFVVLLAAHWAAVETRPEAVFLHVVLEGQRLQVAQLVEGEEVLDDGGCVFDEGGAGGQACVGGGVPKSSKPGLK